MTTTDYIQLQNVRGVGPKRFANITSKLDETGQTLASFFAMSPEAIKEQFRLPINVAQAIADASKPSDHEEVREKNESDPLSEKGIIALKRGADNYPKRLENLLGDKAPEVIYAWGNMELLDKPAVGFCGSRNVTEKGLDVTKDAAQQITELGWVIVSGHARGADTTAHRAALENGGSTIIVAPQGILGFKLRRELKDVAKPEQILIVSEFPPDARWTVWRAMNRNKTIIGLSDAMILVEARKKGGTFQAGQTAVRLGTPLFVAHYETPGETAAGNQYFLNKGAFALKKSKETGKANIRLLQEMITLQQVNASSGSSEKSGKEKLQQLPLMEL